MSFQVYLAFIAACWLLAWTPGPTMALTVANTLSHDRRAGFMTIAGSITGLSLLVTAAALGMNSLMVFVATWFDLLRWIGAAYLVWLGVARLRSALAPVKQLAVANGSTRGRFSQGLAVGLSNPKVLLFLGAFFPQFIDPAQPAALQLAVLAVTFVVVIALADLAIVMLAGRMRRGVSGSRWRIMDGISGGLLLAGGALLLAVRRP